MEFSFPATVTLEIVTLEIVTLENVTFETTVSRINGLFRMRLGETEFECRNLYGWKPLESPNPIPEIFLFDESRKLKFATVQYRIPQVLLRTHKEIPATLTLTFNSNVPQFDPAQPWQIRLEFENQLVERTMTELHFESDYRLLEKGFGTVLPLKNCLGCAYSDYSPYGGDSIGTMNCARVCKSEYLKTQSKDDVMDLWEKHIDDIEIVPEIYCCEEFVPRDSSKHIGYRG